MALLKPVENGRMYPGWWRWNPIGGCEHGCSYCYMKVVQKRCPNSDVITPVFRNGEDGTENYFKDNLGSGRKIFCCSSGDAWGDWVPQKWQRDMLERCVEFPDNEYMFLTKNPVNYLSFSVFEAGELDCVLGATIETDEPEISQEVGVAPDPLCRLEFMKRVVFENPVHTMISVEPVMKFSGGFGGKLADVGPGSIYIGVDSGKNALPEPTRDELRGLIRELEEYMFIDVRLKKGIERIVGSDWLTSWLVEKGMEAIG